MPQQSTDETNSQPEVAAPRPSGRVNVFFRMAAILVALFVMTIFALIAIMFGDPAAPVAMWLDRYGMQLIIGEMCAILIVGTLAMTVDRRTISVQSGGCSARPDRSAPR
jgi:hypothetical protein